MVGPYFDHDAALQLVEYAMKAHPSNAELVSAEAVALAMGGYDEAGDALEKALEMNPADVSCLASYGVWLKGEGDYEGAEAAYKAALRMTPGDPVIMVNMGALLEKWQGDWDMAHIWYKRALNIDPSNQRALLARGHIFENVFLDMDAAQDFYTQAGMRGHEPSLAAEGLWRAGLIHWQSFNDTCKAYGLFSRARMVDPTHTQGLHALAALEAQSGDVDEALTLYQDAVRLLPSDPDTVGELADLYQSAGRIDESESTYLATLKLRPTDVDAMKGYAHLLKHHRGQKAMAAQLFDMSKTLQADRERREELEQQQFDAVLSPPLLLLHLCATAPFPVLAPPTLTHAPPRMRFRGACPRTLSVKLGVCSLLTFRFPVACLLPVLCCASLLRPDWLSVYRLLHIPHPHHGPLYTRRCSIAQMECPFAFSRQARPPKPAPPPPPFPPLPRLACSHVAFSSGAGAPLQTPSCPTCTGPGRLCPDDMLRTRFRPAALLPQEDERGRQICKSDRVSHDIEGDLEALRIATG